MPTRRLLNQRTLAAGTHESPDAGLNFAPEDGVTLRAILGTADCMDASLHITIEIFRSLDGGVMWEPFAKATWVGGYQNPITGEYPPPDISIRQYRVDGVKLQEQRLKAVLTLNRSVSIGAEISY